MLPLIKSTDVAEIVCTTDPSVKLKAADRADIEWILASGVKTDGNETVVTARALTSSELLRCQGFINDGTGAAADLTVHASRAGCLKVKAPGLIAEAPDEVAALLDRLEPAVLASLGGWVLARSLEMEDPIAASG